MHYPGIGPASKHYLSASAADWVKSTPVKQSCEKLTDAGTG
jgi:hypothetical protein